MSEVSTKAPTAAGSSRALPRSRQRPALRATALSLWLLAVTVLAGGLLEYVARARNPFGYERSPSRRLVYQLRPGRADHNAFGQRDRDYPLEKPPGAFRVVGIGDSLTYGMGVARDRVFLKLAERQLAERFGRPVEVINLGVPGYNTAMEDAVFEEVAPRWDPDLAVFLFCRNDFDLPNFVQTKAPALVTHSYALHAFLTALAASSPDFVKRRIMGYRYGLAVFPVPGLEHVPFEQGNPIGDPTRVAERYRYMLGIDGVRNAIARIVATSRARGIPALFLVGWGGGDQDVEQWLAAAGLPVVDLWPHIRAHLDERHEGFEHLWVAPTDPHPNEEGHAVIGEALAEALAPRVAAAAR